MTLGLVHTSVIIVIVSNIHRLSSILLISSTCLSHLGDKCVIEFGVLYDAYNYDYDAGLNHRLQLAMFEGNEKEIFSFGIKFLPCKHAETETNKQRQKIKRQEKNCSTKRKQSKTKHNLAILLKCVLFQ